jgi:hypothetical protein
MPWVCLFVCKKLPKIAKMGMILLQNAPKGSFLPLFRPKTAKNYGLKGG